MAPWALACFDHYWPNLRTEVAYFEIHVLVGPGQSMNKLK
jgi:hypothetical protein